MPFPCRSPVALIHTSHAAPLPFSDSAVSFVKVHVVEGNIRTASPATTLYKRCLVSHWSPASEIGTLLVTTFVELRVVAGRSRTRLGRPHAVSGRPMLIHTYHAVTMPLPCRGLEKSLSEQHGRGMACVNQTRPHWVNQMGKTQSKSLAERHGRGTAWEQHGMCELDFTVACSFTR
jgi:hypothetical protein